MWEIRFYSRGGQGDRRGALGGARRQGLGKERRPAGKACGAGLCRERFERGLYADKKLKRRGQGRDRADNRLIEFLLFPRKGTGQIGI